MTRKTGDASAQLAEDESRRDFSRTEEPGSRRRSGASGSIFAIQKHAASRLHYDFRLELDEVLKSWAVPKGPSVNASVRRRAVEVEDHPIDYTGFQGVIPAGEHGGGSVMLWDVGTYRYIGAKSNDAIDTRDALRDGKLQFFLDGVRLRGVWTLVRTGKPDAVTQWLLMRHKDGGTLDFVESAEVYTTSVASGRTMKQIADDGRQQLSCTASPIPLCNKHDRIECEGVDGECNSQRQALNVQYKKHHKTSPSFSGHKYGRVHQRRDH